jgi:hypothetical protein
MSLLVTKTPPPPQPRSGDTALAAGVSRQLKAMRNDGALKGRHRFAPRRPDCADPPGLVIGFNGIVLLSRSNPGLTPGANPVPPLRGCAKPVHPA